MKWGRSTVRGILVIGMMLSMSYVSVNAQSKIPDTKVKQMGSYEEILGLFEQSGLLYSQEEYDLKMKELNKWPLVEDAVAQPTMDGKPDVSTTNTQVGGVDEGDRVKFDEKTIYTLSASEVKLLDARPSYLTEIAHILAPQGVWYEQMYMQKDQLIIIGEKNRYFYPLYDIMPGRLDANSTADNDSPCTVVEIYDVSNPGMPKMLKSIEVDGNGFNSRVIGEQLYMVTTQHLPILIEGKYSKEQVLPGYRVGKDVEEQTIPFENIRYVEGETIESYTILTSIDTNTNKIEDMEVFLGATNEIYMNQESIYLTQVAYEEVKIDNELGYEPFTKISKYALGDDMLTWIGRNCIEGGILNQFSMDEYKGYFRIATTTSKGNQICILDEKLREVGAVKGLAPRERIYAVKFMGEMGYVVTFVQVDPLYAIDLGTPTAPKVIGELKIPGFSNYLHPVGDGFLLGIGRNTVDLIERRADGTEIVVGVRDKGLKISLFDVTNPKKPKEVSTYPIEGTYSWSEANSTHKAFLYDEQNQTIYIPVLIMEQEELKNYTLVYKLKDGKLIQKAKLQLPNDMLYGETRLGYIGDNVYSIEVGYNGVTIQVIDRKTLSLKNYKDIRNHE